MASKPVTIRVKADTAQAQARIGTLSNSVNRSFQSMTRSGTGMNTRLVSLGKSLQSGLTHLTRYAKYGLLAAAAAFTAVTVKGAAFQFELQKVANIAGATSAQMGSMSDKARELGASTAYTATQVVGGMQALASMGLATEEVNDTIEHALYLAGSFGAEIETASSGIVVAMNNFGLAVSDAQMITDRFTTTLQNSRFSGLEPLMGAFKEASVNAGALGMSLDDTLTAAKLFTDAGYEASRAGSMFNMSMRQLANQTPKMSKALEDLGIKYSEVNPEQNSFVDLLERFAETALTSEQAIKIFGARAGLAVKRVVDQFREAPESVTEFTDKLKESAGTTADNYERLMDTVQGWWKKFLSEIEASALNAFDAYSDELKGVLEDMVKKVTAFGEWLAKPETQEGIRSFFNSITTGAKEAVAGIKEVIEWYASKQKSINEMNAYEKEYAEYLRSQGVETDILTRAMDKLKGAWAGLNKTAWDGIKAFVGTADQSKENAKAWKAARIELEMTGRSYAELYHELKKHDLVEASGIIFTDEFFVGYEKWLKSQEELNLRLATGAEVINSVAGELQTLGIDVDAIRDKVEEAGGSMVTLGAALEEALPEDYTFELNFEANTASIHKIRSDVEGAANTGMSLGIGGMIKTFSKYGKEIQDKIANSTDEGFREGIKGFDEKTKAALIQWRFQLQQAIEEGSKAGAVELSSELQKAAEKLAGGMATALLDSTKTPNYQAYLTNVKTDLHAYARAALTEAFTQAILDKQIIQPLVDTLSQIDLSTTEGISSWMAETREAIGQATEKMQNLWPVVEMLQKEMDALIPTVEDTGDTFRSTTDEAGRALQNMGYGAYGAEQDLGSFAGATNTGASAVSNLARAAGSAASAMYRQGTQYASNTRTPGSSFITGVDIEPVTIEGVRFASGIEHVPRTGPAMLHEGERIIRKQDVRTDNSRTISIQIQALDPIGMKQVVERDIAPLIADYQRRTW